ncbi:sigma factor-like helix-turn-helix DNA-binding protein [Cohnella cholangitidis]|uniref:sigma factor-like helix-turn-helix DNA-binding protein n=1 Tax=Cohnella cholangitidis TaxID=2598458 RepID=UPI003898EA05
MALQDIGDQHGISRERVRQVINSSCRRIRYSCHFRYDRKDYRHPSVILFQTLQSWIMPGSSQDTFYFACFLMRLSSFPSTRIIEQVYISFSGDQKRQRKTFERMFSHTIWPKDLKKTSQTEWVKLHPKRTVNQEGEGKAGSFFSNYN